jgi:hypothetical protein
MVMLFASSTLDQVGLLSFLNQEQRNFMENQGIFLLATYGLWSWEGDGTRFPMSFLGLSFLTGGIRWDYYQDAKEHLSALVHQLGPSLVDIELSGKQKRQGIGVRSTEEQEGQGCHIILRLSGVASLYIL